MAKHGDVWPNEAHVCIENRMGDFAETPGEQSSVVFLEVSATAQPCEPDGHEVHILRHNLGKLMTSTRRKSAAASCRSAIRNQARKRQGKKWLIRGSRLKIKEQSGLLTVALMAAMRSFSRDILKKIFPEELLMLEKDHIIDWSEVPTIGEWFKEAKARAVAQGVAQGVAASARRLTRSLLEQRFGNTPVIAAEADRIRHE